MSRWLTSLPPSSAYLTSRLQPIHFLLVFSAVLLIYHFFAYRFDLSFDCGTFSSCSKDAFLTPVLKKSGFPAFDPSSYQPISNLSVISKLHKCLVAQQLSSFSTSYFLPSSLASGLVSLLNLPSPLSCMTFLILAKAATLLSWPFLVFLPLLTWLTATVC
jgi:hypothetical protein